MCLVERDENMLLSGIAFGIEPVALRNSPGPAKDCCPAVWVVREGDYKPSSILSATAVRVWVNLNSSHSDSAEIVGGRNELDGLVGGIDLSESITAFGTGPEPLKHFLRSRIGEQLLAKCVWHGSVYRGSGCASDA